MDQKEDEILLQSNIIKLSELKYNYSIEYTSNKKSSKEEALKVEMMKIINENSTMNKLYNWNEVTLENKYNAEVTEELKLIETKIENSLKEEGETEVRDALLNKADIYSRIGDKESALTAYEVALKKTIGAGPRIDVIFSMLRVSLFDGDLPLIKKQLDSAQKLIDEGGDWDRRNRLKVYSAVYYIMVRNIPLATSLLLEAVATFTTTELFSYNQFVLYLVLASLMKLDRPTLQSKVIKAPEVIAALIENSEVSTLLSSFYNCNYDSYLASLINLLPVIVKDRYLGPHSAYLVRELRLVAYNQFLTSYKSVTLESMSKSFGISVGALDEDIARFVYAGRLHCKVDKVAGVIECSRPDPKHAQYAAVLKQGDSLLNRVQKLARVISY